MTPNLQGYIRDIHYAPCLTQPLARYDWDQFDINAAKGYGVVALADGDDGLAFSKWVSPKRTRSYPFARIYNTYGQNRKCVTIIPVIKDEGVEGDNDRINAITFSWMSLLNVYIILAWYDDARASRRAGKITGQRFNNDYIRQQLEAVSRYRLSALHWNVAHFERDFAAVYLRAVESYQQISRRTGVSVHAEADHLRVLEAFAPNARLEIDLFKQLTGQLQGKLSLPTDLGAIAAFADTNTLKPSERALVEGLDREARTNKGLEIMIGEIAV